MKKSIYLYLLSITIFLSGCASMGKYDKVYYENAKIYPFVATGADVGIIYNNIVQGKPDGERPDPFDFIYEPEMIPLFILDIPFSIVTDVITLPFDLFYCGRRLYKTSRKTECALVANPDTPENIIMKIHEKSDIPLSPFARNPNCPSTIRKEILASDNRSAKEWLEITDKGKENGTYFIDANGRWYRPKPKLRDAQHLLKK
jgi:uncharacterized protein YceK